MPKKLLIPKKKTSIKIDYGTFAKIEEAARELNKTNSEIMELAILAGIDAIRLALNPKNALFLKQIGDKYQNDLQAD